MTPDKALEGKVLCLDLILRTELTWRKPTLRVSYIQSFACGLANSYAPMNALRKWTDIVCLELAVGLTIHRTKTYRHLLNFFSIKTPCKIQDGWPVVIRYNSEPLRGGLQLPNNMTHMLSGGPKIFGRARWTDCYRTCKTKSPDAGKGT